MPKNCFFWTPFHPKTLIVRFHHPEQARERQENDTIKQEDGGKDRSPTRDEANKADWEFAHSELLEREGVDLKVEMEQKMKEMEELWRKEKEEATQAFQQERKKYEDQIETLQKQVMEQSMTMSMISSMTPDDFNQEDDLYGKDDSLYNVERKNDTSNDIFENTWQI